jgi:hypothetical protein
VHGPRATRLRDADRFRNVAGEAVGALAHPRGFADRRSDIHLAHFWNDPDPELVGRRVPGKKQHRRLGMQRREQRRYGIRVTRTAGDERDARDRRRCASMRPPCAAPPPRGARG